MSEDWGAEYARMRKIIKSVHGALTDAGSVVVPGTLEGDLAPAIQQLTRERDEAREQEAQLVKRVEELEGVVEAFTSADPCPECGHGVSLECYGCKLKAAETRVKGLERDVLDRALAAEHRAEASEAKLARCVEALEDISEGAGPFDRDPLIHAMNCIEAMKLSARAALAAAKGGE